jgi:TorA maturation chaperone TorD
MSVEARVSTGEGLEPARLRAEGEWNEILPDELGLAAVARADMYRFLSAVYLFPPSDELLRQLLKADFFRELCSLFSCRPVAELERFATAFEPQRDFAALKQEYMDLFAVPTGRYVTPFEDVYRVGTEENQPRGPLLGCAAVAVIRMYREAGASLDRTCKELPTHIGVELSFMSFLCQREAEIVAAAQDSQDAARARAGCIEYRAIQTRFLRDHLSEWFPRLSQVIQAQTRSALYRGLALMTDEFLSEDLAHLSAPVG